MINYLIIWGMGILIFSSFIIWHYQKKPNDRLSCIATILILILWPLTFISIAFLLTIVWFEEKFNNEIGDFEYKERGNK